MAKKNLQKNVAKAIYFIWVPLVLSFPAAKVKEKMWCLLDLIKRKQIGSLDKEKKI